MIVPTSARRVLVADDEESVRRLLQDGLTRVGFEVELSAHGDDLLHRYRCGDYGLLILDVRMSPQTGLDVVMVLRGRGDPVPIILMSPSCRRKDRMAPFAYTYRVQLLRKPFGLEELRKAVAHATRLAAE
jgi:DNA-binding response OmpR family regulator